MLLTSRNLRDRTTCPAVDNPRKFVWLRWQTPSNENSLSKSALLPRTAWFAIAASHHLDDVVRVGNIPAIFATCSAILPIVADLGKQCGRPIFHQQRHLAKDLLLLLQYLLRAHRCRCHDPCVYFLILRHLKSPSSLLETWCSQERESIIPPEILSATTWLSSPQQRPKVLLSSTINTRCVIWTSQTGTGAHKLKTENVNPSFSACKASAPRKSNSATDLSVFATLFALSWLYLPLSRYFGKTR